MTLDHFFSPQGIAVVGASTDPAKLGYAVARNLIRGGYPGLVHLVNPKGGTLFDRPLYTSITQVPDPVDLAVVIVPAPAAPKALREAGERGIRAAILTSGGFKETGAEGAILEDEVVRVCKDFNIRLLGPNCIGLLDTHLPLDTTFLPPPPPAPGNIAFLSQSGAFCAAVIDWSRGQGFGFSRLISLGNQADLTETDLLPHVVDDPHTRAVALYLETISDGRRFIDTARRLAPHKPLVALKVGRTASGQKAAASHTGALVSSDAAVDASFEKAGILRASTAEELFDWSRALAVLPLPSGRRVAILTNAGGPGVIAADALAANNLTLAVLEPATVAGLRRLLPPAAGLHNPVDMLASAPPDDYAACLHLLLDDPNVDGVLLILPPSPIHTTGMIADALLPLMRESAKPVLAALMGSHLVRGAADRLIRADLPFYSFPERAASALARLADRAEFLKEIETPSLPPPRLDRGRIDSILNTSRNDPFDPTHAFRLMDAIDIPTAPIRHARTEEESARLAGEVGFPLVAKIASPDILHKSDIGGVLLEIDSVEAAARAFHTLTERAQERRPGARIEGVTLQHQVPTGQEVILGAVRDPQFGTLMMFGAGGVDVEARKDVAFAIAPLTEREAARMIARTFAGRKLDGFRNIVAVDRAAVVDALVRLSLLADEYQEITEIEINPLSVSAVGAIALDVRIKLD
jgi:acetyl coenzyme A synthetase (ADP forming)-like protein